LKNTGRILFVKEAKIIVCGMKISFFNYILRTHPVRVIKQNTALNKLVNKSEKINYTLLESESVSIASSG
jgi:hypothetical protein